LLYVLVIVVSSVFVSCQEKEDDSLQKITDTIRGRYNVESVTWEGNPIDANNDGLCSNDILEEFKDFLCMTVGLIEFATVRIPEAYDETAIVKIPVFFQDILYNELDDEFLTIQFPWNGSCGFMLLPYKICRDGSFSFSKGNLSDDVIIKEWQIYVQGLDKLLTEEGEIIEMGNDRLKVRMLSGFYDFKTQELIQDYVTYVYKRVSYKI